MQSEKNTFSWSEFYAHRKEIRKLYPSVYKLALKKKLLDVVTGELRGGEKILDVGASTRRLGERIKKKVSGITYKTMDIDRAKEHDYYSTNEIKETFDVIVLSEVIEHLSFQDGIDLLKRLNGLLAAGGRLVVSVPNIHHPNAYLRDSDHKTPYSYEVLGAALINAGLKVKRLYRIYNDSLIRRFFRLYVMAWLHRYLDVDFAKHVAAIAEKP